MSSDLDCFKRTVVFCAVVMLTVCYRAHNALVTICIVFHSIHSPHSFLRISRFLYCFCILRIYTAHFETSAIKTALGDSAKTVMVSSTKGNTGHLLGAAGAVEAIACIKAIEDKFVPPTINYKVPDEECDLDIVPNDQKNKIK